MKKSTRISAFVLLGTFLFMMLHNVVPHVHHSHDLVDGLHHDLLDHSIHSHNTGHSHHSHDDHEDESGDWDFLALLFAYHSHTVEVPSDCVVLEGLKLTKNSNQQVAELNASMWSPSRDGPLNGVIASRSQHYHSRLPGNLASLRAPPALG